MNRVSARFLASRLQILFLLATILLACGATPATCDDQVQTENEKMPREQSLGLAESRELTVENQTDLMKRCNPRVCFAIDGSSSITASQFEVQKKSVILTAEMLSMSSEAQFSAVQYGLIISEISPFAPISSEMEPTKKENITDFISLINGTEQVKSEGTFIAPGLQYCVSELSRGENKDPMDIIVIIGDGKSNFGDFAGEGGAISIAKQFVEGGAKLFSVILGGGKGGLLNDIVDGDKSRIVRIKEDKGNTEDEESGGQLEKAINVLVTKICA